MRLLGETKSLLLTGLADVWAGRKDTRGRPGDRVGLELMVVSAAMFALMAAVAKKLLPHTPMQAVVFSRGVLMTTVFVAMARRRGVPILGKQPWVLLDPRVPAVAAYYDAEQHWRPSSLERRRVLRGR